MRRLTNDEQQFCRMYAEYLWGNDEVYKWRTYMVYKYIVNEGAVDANTRAELVPDFETSCNDRVTWMHISATVTAHARNRTERFCMWSQLMQRYNKSKGERYCMLYHIY